MSDSPSVARVCPSVARVPGKVWRADSGFRHDERATAGDCVRYEQLTLGNSLGLSPACIAALDAYPASALAWVTFDRRDARRYGEPVSYQIDVPAKAIATDGEGGFLLLFPQLPSPFSPRGRTMSKEKNEPHFAPPRGNDPFDDRGDALRPELKHELSDDKIRADITQAKRDADEEDEKRRRAGRGSGDASPALAKLAHNVRPDLEDTPAGIAVVTTAKSADYRATREDAQPIAPQEPEARRAAEEPREDSVAREAREESDRRQDAERRARNGEGNERDAAHTPSLRESLAVAAAKKREERGEAEHFIVETLERTPGAGRDGGSRGGGGRGR